MDREGTASIIWQILVLWQQVAAARSCSVRERAVTCTFWGTGKTNHHTDRAQSSAHFSTNPVCGVVPRNLQTHAETVRGQLTHSRARLGSGLSQLIKMFLLRVLQLQEKHLLPSGF